MRRSGFVAQGNTLCFETAVIDAGVDVEFCQALIGKPGPAFTPLFDKLGAVPVPDFWTKPVLVNRAHREP